MPQSSCPLCDGTRIEVRPETSWNYYNCHTCGQYYMGDIARHEIQDDTSIRPQRTCVSTYIQTQNLQHRTPFLYYRRIEDIENTERIPVISIKEIIDQFPKEFSERQQRALLNLGRLTEYLGHWLQFDPPQYPLVYALLEKEYKFVLDSLKTAGYLEYGRDVPGMGTSFSEKYRLSPAGWDRIAELERQAAVYHTKQVFVAMWFDAAMLECYRLAFREAIEAAGYKPVVIIDREFNGDIHDEILAEIRKSRFVIADFTGQRPNVYFEAGFAEGLGLEVIYTCREDQINESHFDIRQRNHLLWKDLTEPQTRTEFQHRLKNRILGTIGLP